MAKKYETQFSIYKVNIERSKKYFLEEDNIEISTVEELEKNILCDIKKNVTAKSRSQILNITNSNFKGFIFKTYHYPTWYGIVDNLIDEEFDISNTHISYVMTYLQDENIFILTAGLGSNYINEFTQKNYGLMLLPKMLKESTPSIKTVLENRLSGNRLSSKHSNRNVTTINTENDMSSIFRELSLEINEEIIELIGIELDKNKKVKVLNLIAKDSFVIKKSISLENLLKVLYCLIEIEKKEDNFPLGYFVDVKKYQYSNKEMKELLYEYLLRGDIDNFILVGDDYSSYCVGGNRYIIKDKENNIIIDSDKPLTFKDVYEQCIQPNLSKSSIDKTLKYLLTVESDNEMVLFPTKLYECIQGHIENIEGKPFFLYNGSWLMFDENYVDNLDKEFKKFYDDIVNIDDDLEKIITNYDHSLTEDSYNKTFKDSEDIIVAHTVLSNNIELADLIYFDENNLYLIHNKAKFQGNGARDVLNQILTSAEFISHYNLSQNKNQILEKYYEEILEKYPNNKIRNVEKDKFVELFTNSSEIYFVAGFMDGVSETTNSNYAKYITIDASKKLNEKGYKLLMFNINK